MRNITQNLFSIEELVFVWYHGKYFSSNNRKLNFIYRWKTNFMNNKKSKKIIVIQENKDVDIFLLGNNQIQLRKSEYICEQTSLQRNS